MNKIKNYFKTRSGSINKWMLSHYLQIAIFNLLLIVLFLLHSAGYFHPFFPLSINVIVLISLFSSIILLSANSRSMFVVSLFFWIFAGLIKVFNVDVWAERTAVYAFESFMVATCLLLKENIVRGRK